MSAKPLLAQETMSAKPLLAQETMSAKPLLAQETMSAKPLLAQETISAIKCNDEIDALHWLGAFYECVDRDEPGCYNWGCALEIASRFLTLADCQFIIGRAIIANQMNYDLEDMLESATRRGANDIADFALVLLGRKK